MLFLAMVCSGALQAASAQNKQQSSAKDKTIQRDISNLSLEELMDIEVTSASKKEEKRFQTAAAIYVITQEEIRRSGLTGIPELLRLVPGMNVARIDGSKWAISARGFNGRFANKLLVLIDGRSVYAPETSGVYWEAQDLTLEDIERIEVIRGPGGTLWGANAVNGVINIITKQARESAGGLVAAGSGSYEHGFGGLRYGGQLADRAHYRAFVKYLNRDGLVDPFGRKANDGQKALSAGGRLDWQMSNHDALTLQGDTYNSRIRETSLLINPVDPFASPTSTRGEFSGGNVLGRWTRIISDESDMALQVYFDRSRRDLRDLGERIDTFDLDFQHHFTHGNRQEIVWGLGYRLVSEDTRSNSSDPVQFKPKGQTAQLFSAFVQDDFVLIRDKLRLTLGAKLEHNDYTGLEVQPSARLRWTPNDRQTFWGAVSRAVRTPARAERAIQVGFGAFPVPSGIPAVLTVFGNLNTRSEELRAFEFGYRVQPVKKLSLDVATFYNLYDHLSSTEEGFPFFKNDPQPHVVIPVTFDNLMKGTTYGLEVSGNWEITGRWKVRSAYTFLRVNLQHSLQQHSLQQHSLLGDPIRFAGIKTLANASSTSPANSASPTTVNDPSHQFQLQSYVQLPRNLEFDTSVYRVARIPGIQIPGYTRLDVRLGWRLNEGTEISLGLQNLLDSRHAEFTGGDVAVVTSQVRRGIYGKVVWRF